MRGLVGIILVKVYFYGRATPLSLDFSGRRGHLLKWDYYWLQGRGPEELELQK